jgi:peptidoglycan hydrolase CwlO-like protein
LGIVAVVEGKKLAALLVGVCVISALIGSGLMYLAKQGPEGPAGPAGARGPQGVRGFSADEEEAERALNDVQDVESHLEDLEREVNELWGYQGEAEAQIAELGGQVTNNTQAISGMCVTLELTGCP